MKLVVMQDKTGSARKYLTPQLSLDDLNRVFAVVNTCGGEVAIGIIDGQSNQPLQRLYLGMPPEKPEEPAIDSNPFSGREAWNDHRKALSEYQVLNQTRDSVNRARFKEFKQIVREALSMPPTASSTDITGAIQRADYYLAEPDPVSVQKPQKIMMIISDAQDNVGNHELPARLESGAHLILVNGTRSIGNLEGLNPGNFESISSAIRYLEQLH